MLDTKVNTHTPGPWDAGSPTETVHDYPERYVSVSVSVKAPNRCFVASVSGGHLKRTPSQHRITNEEALANARLIAAAPDLLQALDEIVGDCYHLDGDSDVPHCRFCDHSEGAKHDPDCVMQFVNAAIAKAEGRS